METFKAYVERIIYRNEDNGYTVLSAEENGCETVCVGVFQFIEEGEWVYDPLFSQLDSYSVLFDKVEEEIKEVKAACGEHILKVIIETCLLTDEEKIKMCEIVSNSNADYIKTSTGFSTGGATKADIELFAKHTTNGKKIKAAGGIASIGDAEEFINLGASRLGTSRIVKIVKNEQGSGY